jgi:hypothetical protein
MVLAGAMTDLLLTKLNSMSLRPPIYAEMFKGDGNTVLSGRT